LKKTWGRKYVWIREKSEERSLRSRVKGGAWRGKGKWRCKEQKKKKKKTKKKKKQPRQTERGFALQDVGILGLGMSHL